MRHVCEAICERHRAAAANPVNGAADIPVTCVRAALGRAVAICASSEFAHAKVVHFIGSRPQRRQKKGSAGAEPVKLEAEVGIEPAYADLQSAA